MKVKVLDAFLMDGVRKTNDGYMTAFAKVSRTGIQLYRGREVGRPDVDIVRVHRPPEEVFSNDAMRSLAHRPVTLLHPPVPVSAANWRQYATGQTGEEVVRDGDSVRVPLVIMDAATIKAVEEGGVRELSVGYSTDIKFTPGVTADGEPYDAIQTDIRANHLAIVPVARGGKELRLGDGGHHPGDWVKSTTPQQRNIPMKTILIDGAAIEVADDNAATMINAHIAKLTKQVADSFEDIKKKEKEKKDCEDGFAGQIAVLNQKLQDAEITPVKLDALVKQRSSVIDAAKKVVADADFAGKTEADIRRQVVDAKLGAAAKDMSDAAIEGAFTALTADGVAQTGVQRLGGAFSHQSVVADSRAIVGDQREVALRERDKYLADAWRGAGANQPVRQ